MNPDGGLINLVNCKEDLKNLPLAIGRDWAGLRFITKTVDKKYSL